MSMLDAMAEENFRTKDSLTSGVAGVVLKILFDYIEISV